MKIHCNVCESAEAGVLCCADEAALCWACDRRVHAANKLAIKHQRVPLSDSSTPKPKPIAGSKGLGLLLSDGDFEAQDSNWAVHEVPSPPTLSGLLLARKVQDPFDSSLFVPEIDSLPLLNFHCRLTGGDGTNYCRRR
ncbi:B-box zinc finger family protein, partial [Striga asiatica]